MPLVLEVWWYVLSMYLNKVTFYYVLSKRVTRWPCLSYCHVILLYSQVSNSFKDHQVIPWTLSLIRRYIFQITGIFPTGQQVYIWRLCDATWHHIYLWFTIESSYQRVVIRTGDWLSSVKYLGTCTNKIMRNMFLQGIHWKHLCVTTILYRVPFQCNLDSTGIPIVK